MNLEQYTRIVGARARALVAQTVETQDLVVAAAATEAVELFQVLVDALEAGRSAILPGLPEGWDKDLPPAPIGFELEG